MPGNTPNRTGNLSRVDSPRDVAGDSFSETILHFGRKGRVVSLALGITRRAKSVNV